MRKTKLIISVFLLLSGALVAGNAKVSGLTFMHYSYASMGDNEFGIRRAYFTYENKLNDAVSYKFQADVGSGYSSAYSVYIKNAKLDWKTKLGKITLGLQGMNIFNIQEKTWGYRFIEKSAMDRKKYASSADLGVGWSNKFGRIGTSIIISNGGGYKRAETNGYKKLSAQLYLGQAKLQNGINVGIVASYEGLDIGPPTANSLVVGGFGGLVLGGLTTGIEYDLNTVEIYNARTSTLISLYSRFNLSENLETFIRVDLFDGGSEFGDDSEEYLITGFNYRPDMGLSVAPNVRITSAEGGTPEYIYYVNFQFKF